MKTLVPHSTEAPYTKNNGNTLTINGIRKLINTDFMNKSLEEARDLWVLSFILMGMDIREILTARGEDVMPGIFMANINKEDKVPIPLYDIGNDIFHKHGGKVYALKCIETGGTPGRVESHRKATRLRFDLNRRMDIITKYLQFGCTLPFENTRLMWMLLAKEHKMDDRVVGSLADFTINVHNRKPNLGTLERTARSNNLLMDFIYGIDSGMENIGDVYPIRESDGSILLYES